MGHTSSCQPVWLRGVRLHGPHLKLPTCVVVRRAAAWTTPRAAYLCGREVCGCMGHLQLPTCVVARRVAALASLAERA